jgi:hypothetical protein
MMWTPSPKASVTDWPCPDTDPLTSDEASFVPTPSPLDPFTTDTATTTPVSSVKRLTERFEAILPKPATPHTTRTPSRSSAPPAPVKLPRHAYVPAPAPTVPVESVPQDEVRRRIERERRLCHTRVGLPGVTDRLGSPLTYTHADTHIYIYIYIIQLAYTLVFINTTTAHLPIHRSIDLLYSRCPGRPLRSWANLRYTIPWHRLPSRHTFRRRGVSHRRHHRHLHPRLGSNPSKHHRRSVP